MEALMPTETLPAPPEQDSFRATLQALDARENVLQDKHDELTHHLAVVNAELEAIKQFYDCMREIQPRT
jgi:hypothetical protein